MLAAKLLTALFALPLVFGQEDTASADAAAPSEAAASEAPAEGAASETVAAAESSVAATKVQTAVGGITTNTGLNISSEDGSGWNQTYFTAPSNTFYWVADHENTAMWNPVQENVNLVLFNSNTTLLSAPKTLVENVDAGTGQWTGEVTGLLSGNNYILVLALTSNPDRKIAQTRGFWIRSANSAPMPVPTTAGAADAGVTQSGASGSAAADASGSAADVSGSAAPSATPGASGAGALVVSVGAIVAAAGLAIAF